jgi:hypothetical protein
MKNLKNLILGALFFATVAMNAQIVKVDRQYGGTPVWAPKTAPTTVKYYYLPDIQTYYNVPDRQYVYMKDGKWVKTTTFPSAYKGYDLRTSRPVYLTDYKGNTPYVLFPEHKAKYIGRPWKPNGKDNGLHKGQYKNKKGVVVAKGKGNGNSQGHGNGKGKGK